MSKGLELVPRNETFDLAESLKLPVDCVNSLESAIAVKLEPLSADICRFIVSDKQVSFATLSFILKYVCKLILCMYDLTNSGFKRIVCACCPMQSSTPIMLMYAYESHCYLSCHWKRLLLHLRPRHL